VAVAVENKMTDHTKRLLGTLFVLLLIVAVVFGLGMFKLYLSGSRESVWPTGVVESYRAGDYQAAVENTAKIVSNPNKTEEAKANAIYNSLGAAYRLSGDKKDMMTDIQNMKNIITNESLSLEIRAATLDVLAKEYDISGNDPAVFAEIYKDAPFNQYLAEGDPFLSSRHLAEWSYQLLPSSNAAIIIARWYTDQFTNNPNLPADKVNEYVAAAVEYLKKADAASVAEAGISSTYSGSRKYLFYRSWRALVVGRLGGQLDEYASQYRQSYNDFITFAESQQNAIAREAIAPTRLAYAQHLTRDKDTDAAKVQLSILAQDIANAGKDNVFVNFLRNEYKYRPNGDRWRVVKSMAAVSPEFKAAVEKVVGVTL
jgi:hypothetical protein